MDQHVVVVGYGTKGRSAIETLVSNGYDRDAIVVVDPSPVAIADGNRDQLVVIAGDATRRGVLRQAGVEKATHVIITTDRDDSNVLVTLTVRQLNPDAWIVAAVREHENVPLMRQSGANSVITSSDAVGRLLGLSSMSPKLGSVMEDLMTYGEGLEVAERDLLVNEVGKQPQSLPDQVIAVVRDEKVYRYFDPVVSLLARGDRLIVVRPAKELPWAPRPGTHGEDAGRRGRLRPVARDRLPPPPLRLRQDPQDRRHEPRDRAVAPLRPRRRRHPDQPGGRGAARRRRGSGPAERRHRPQLVRPHGGAPGDRGDRSGDVGRLLHLRRRAEPVRRGRLVLPLQRPQADLHQDVRRVRAHPAAHGAARPQRAALPPRRAGRRRRGLPLRGAAGRRGATSRRGWASSSTSRTPSRGAARTTASSTAPATPRSWRSASPARSGSSATSSEPSAGAAARPRPSTPPRPPGRRPGS